MIFLTVAVFFCIIVYGIFIEGIRALRKRSTLSLLLGVFLIICSVGLVVGALTGGFVIVGSSISGVDDSLKVDNKNPSQNIPNNSHKNHVDS